MRYEGETGNAPWNDEGPVLAALRPVRVRTNWEATPNVTDLPVPGDPTPCTTGNPEQWVGTSDSGATYAAWQCKFCWMQPDCAEYGIEHPDEIGVWGGLSQKQRKYRHATRYSKPKRPREIARLVR